MPELPEVQAVVDYLIDRIHGDIIKEVDVLWHRTIASHSAAKFKSLILEHSVKQVSRRGKYIVIALDGKTEQFLFIHLRMTGSIDVLKNALPASKHDRLIIRFSSGKQLIFSDTRKFGRMFLTPDPLSITKNLGLEPLDANLNVVELAKQIKSKNGMIKPLLLNQRILVGVGNIYADEALWAAKIHPKCKAKDLTIVQLRNLILAIRRILNLAIKKNGTDFGDGVVDGGMYSPKIYGRAGKPCKRCRFVVKKLVVGQRGTSICPKCQKL